MQGRGRKKQILLFGQKSAVGSEDDLESCGPSQFQKLAQMRMEQRFSHQVEVKIVRKGAQFGKQGGEFFDGHGMFLPLRSRTEGAAQVAQIGNFQINFVESLHIIPRSWALVPDGHSPTEYR